MHHLAKESEKAMKNFVNSTLLAGALVLAVGVTGARAQVSVGIQIGTPPPPRAVIVQPVAPAPDYVWIEGYWYPVGHHYKWHPGYWTEVPYAGARWVAPRYEGGRYFVGYWDGDRGRVEHDHRWDRDKDRDYHDHGRWDNEDHNSQGHHDRDDH